MKKERLREAVKQVQERRATAGIVADVVRGQLLATHSLGLTTNRLAKLGRP
jgi:uncharacterized protein involved in exopolysaccharide biosynthesis